MHIINNGNLFFTKAKTAGLTELQVPSLPPGGFIHDYYNYYFHVRTGWKKLQALTNFMDLRPSWGPASCTATQELPSILWNPQVHCSVQKSPPPVPILSHINPIHTIPSYLRSTLILSTHIRLGLPRGLFPFCFPNNFLYAFLSSPFVLHALPTLTSLTWSF
jgi:hypothetical protein